MRRKPRDKTTLEADTVGYMPERFIAGYFELVRLGLQVDPSAQQFDDGGGSPKKKYRGHGGGLKDERALRFKAWVDRQLRAVGRDIQAYLNAREGNGPSPIGMSEDKRREIARELEQKTELKCRAASCGKYISWQWNHCAWCGHPIVKGKDAQVSNDGNRSDGESDGSSSEPTLTIGLGKRSPHGRAYLDREDGAASGQDAEGTSGSTA